MFVGSFAPASAQTGPQAVGIGVGGDNLTRLLWNNPNGSASLWCINSDNSITAYTYGPFAGWSGASLAVGTDNVSHILWDNTNGYETVWDVNNQGVQTNANTGVSYLYSGYTGTAVAVGPNNAVRTMWTKPGGFVSLWDLSQADPAGSRHDYSSSSSWTIPSLAVGPDSVARLLWDNASGSISLWKVDTAGNTSAAGTDPASGWMALSVAVDGGGSTHLLWDHPSDSTIQLWTVSPSYTTSLLAGLTSYNGYTDPVGFRAKLLACGPDGKVRLLWTKPGGTVQVWTIAASGNYTSATYTNMASLPAPTSLTTVAAVNNQSSLSWSASSAATSYNVKRSTTSGSGYSTVANVTSTSYIDQGLTNGTTYYYVVTAVNATNESAPSNQVTATPTAQSFGFLNIGGGSVLSGEVALQVSMASNTYGDEGNQVTLQVDGQDYDAGGDIQTAVSGSSGANTTFDLDTEMFANGSHTLTVKDMSGHTVSISVTFSNTFSLVNIPSIFDTTGGDGLPTSAAISANLGTAKSWTVTINTYDNASTVVKTFSGNSSTINVTWDGTNANGNMVDDDVYEVALSTTASSTSTAALSTTASSTSTVTRKIVNKNTPGDCFLLIDPAVYPNRGDLKPYLAAVKADLAPSKGNVWNKLSMFVATNRKLTVAQVNRINRHFTSPLTVFYFAGHGGIYNGPEFGVGGHFWHASYGGAYPYSPNADDNMQALTASANYDPINGNYPPALVFIDSCKSTGGTRGVPLMSGDDTTFASDFGSANLFGAFLGWNGDAIEYGAYRPPLDDWTFWRLDLWAQFTNVNQTYATDWSNLNRDYNNKGPAFPYDNRPSTRMRAIYTNNVNF